MLKEKKKFEKKKEIGLKIKYVNIKTCTISNFNWKCEKFVREKFQLSDTILSN